MDSQDSQDFALQNGFWKDKEDVGAGTAGLNSNTFLKPHFVQEKLGAS